MKEIRSYLDPGVKLNTASSWQVIKAAVEMETFSKDWKSIYQRANKLQGGGDGGGRGRGMKDLSCYRCGEKGHFTTTCPIKREEAVCTFKDCPTPNGHLIKACKNKNKGPKKGGKGKKKEEKAKKSRRR